MVVVAPLPAAAAAEEATARDEFFFFFLSFFRIFSFFCFFLFKKKGSCFVFVLGVQRDQKTRERERDDGKIKKNHQNLFAFFLCVQRVKEREREKRKKREREKKKRETEPSFFPPTITK